MRVGSAFLQTFVVQVTQSVASIAAGIFIARGLGPKGQGEYAIFQAAVALGVVLGSLGQFESNVLSSAGKAVAGRALVGRSLIQSLLVALVVLAGFPLWARLEGGEGLVAVGGFFVVVLALEVEAQLLRGINLGQHHITAYNVSPLIQRVSYASLVLILTLVTGLQIGRVLSAWAAATTVSVTFTAVWIWVRSDPAGIDLRRLFAQWRTDLGRGARALVTLAFTLGLLRCDIWMLGPLVGVSTVGQMSIAIALAEWLWYLPYILGTVLFAAVAADATRAVGQITRASRGVVAVLWPGALFLMAAGAYLVPLVYGRAYQPAGLLFVILVPGMAAIALHIVVDSYFAGRGFPPISMWSASGALAAKVGLNFLVIPRYGAVGAAAVTSIVYVGLTGVKVIAFARRTSTPFKDILLPTRDDIRANVAMARTWAVSAWGRSGRWRRNA